MSNKKKDKLRKLKHNIKKQHGRNRDRLEKEWGRLVEEDLKEIPGYPDIPDIDRKRKMWIGAFRRLHEYDKNIKRHPDDPQWEYCSSEQF